MLRLALLIAALPALAAPSKRADDDLSAPERFPTEGQQYATRALFPSLTDVRFGLTSDLLASHATLFLGADRGLIQLGSGVLGAGIDLGGGRCLAACGRYAPTLLVSRLVAMAAARVVYHLMASGDASALAHLGFYFLADAGAAFSFVDEDDSTSVRSAITWAPFAGAGAGATYFFGTGDVMFAGGELHATYMPGFNNLSQVALAPQSLVGLGGFRFVLFVGLRL